MGHSVGDGIIVVALAAIVIAYLYFKPRERQRRLEVIHQERLAAMDKGIPLPEAGDRSADCAESAQPASCDRFPCRSPCSASA